MDGVSLVSCATWIRRGVCKQNPDKVQLTKEELESAIEETKGTLRNLDLSAGECEEYTEKSQNDREESGEDDEDPGEEDITDADDPYNMANYDDVEDSPKTTPPFTGIINNDIYAADDTTKAYQVQPKMADVADSDSEAEDLRINSDENMIVTGEVDGDSSQLVFYVFNEDEGSIYVHHDIMMASYPLCVEWLNFDRELSSPGNLVAVGTMTPTIDVWDVDVVNSLEPAYSLGGANKSRHKKSSRQTADDGGHTDAVISLAWNNRLEHLLASGSADHTVALWDLQSGAMSYRLCCRDKVQSLTWRPTGSVDHLLSGDGARHVRLWHCSSQDSKHWKLSGEVEQVVWDHFSSDGALAATDDGKLHYIDVRVDKKPVWSVQAHGESCTALSLSPDIPGCLVTVSSDRSARVWDIAAAAGDSCPAAQLVASHELKLGSLHCVSACAELSWMLCVGGDRRDNNFRVWDIRQLEQVREVFGSRKPMKVTPDNGHPSAESAMDSSVAMETSSAAASNAANSTPAKKAKKARGKKKTKDKFRRHDMK